MEQPLIDVVTVIATPINHTVHIVSEQAEYDGQRYGGEKALKCQSPKTALERTGES
jgi:hypothetical protein